MTWSVDTRCQCQTVISGERGHDDADRHLLPGEQSARTGGNQLPSLCFGKGMAGLWDMNR